MHRVFLPFALLGLVACGQLPTVQAPESGARAIATVPPIGTTMPVQVRLDSTAGPTRSAPSTTAAASDALPTVLVTPSPPVLAVPPGGLAQPIPAPELADEIWLNSPRLALADLRRARRVTLVEFWTFDCYNCRNVLPALRTWHATYTSKGLTIIGVHFPEFSYERDLDNVRQAVKSLDVKYPVAIDNDGRTWRAYHQNAWPTLYLVDKQGNIRYVHVGEGAYETTEQWIRFLLSE